MSEPKATLPPEEREQLAALCESRSATYGFLARLYQREVDADYLKLMRGMRFPASTGNMDVDDGHRMIVAYLSSVWENSVEELAIDYSRTFIGSGVDAYSAAYPNESVYTSERRLLMQEARDEVRVIYRSMGLKKLDSYAENDDHIAVELEFMKEICSRAAEALRAGDEIQAIKMITVQKNFHEDHLANWVPMMTADMRLLAKTGLYQGLARLTDGFLEVEGAFLEEILCEG
ncbi:MAG: molecular chaperone TorD family protein [Eggerthellaceae bacterium]|nr:molecular chaperone TorD family protein [Eggerthellaceae bacterium]